MNPGRLEIVPPWLMGHLAAAGVNKGLFTSDAVAILHEAASGSLRDIDRVAHNAVRSSARRKRKLIERDVVQAILQADSYLSPVP